MKSCTTLVIAMSLLPSVASAQQPASQPKDRVWIDINFLSKRPSQGDQTYSATVVPFAYATPAATTTTYPAFPSTVGAGIDGGIFLRGGFGVGIHFEHSNYAGSVAVAATVPHPIVPSGPTASATASAETPETRETAVDISAVYRLRLGGKWQVRVFGGPSYLRMKQSMLNHYSYGQTFDFIGQMNTLDISASSFRTEDVAESAWGFHAGADVQYFFNRHVGVGAVVRMNRGTVSLTEPLTHASTDVHLGHVSVGGGLRLKL